MGKLDKTHALKRRIRTHSNWYKVDKFRFMKEIGKNLLTAMVGEGNQVNVCR